MKVTKFSKSVNETLVKVSKIDENELTQQLQEKLAKGKLQDANNDGIVDETDIEAAKEIIKEVITRLNFLINIGLDYLTISRKTKTLSGGESQRIRIASQIGSELSNAHGHGRVGGKA